MDFKYLCRTCRRQGTFRDGSPGCAKFNIKVNPEEDFCAWHEEKNISTCVFCGETNGLILAEFNNQWYYICPDHLNVLYTCQACEHADTCGFKEDHTEQQYVMRQTRQGPMIVQQQVKNPSLITKHCATCHCAYGDAHNCFKEEFATSPGCPNWQLKTGLLP